MPLPNPYASKLNSLPDMSLYRTLFKITLAGVVLTAILLLSACSTEMGKLSIEPAGICATSADGHYRVCYDPFSKGYTVTTAVPGGIVSALTYDSASRSWRGSRPDGSTIVYAGGRLTIEPPLPQK